HGGFLGGGINNQVSGDYSALVGGQGNNIGPSGVPGWSFIGGGYQNTITGAGDASVVGGSMNTVSAQNSAILGGDNNTVSGAYSSILGGANLSLGNSYSFGFKGEPFGTSVGLLQNVDLILDNTDGAARKLKFHDAGTHYSSFEAA